MSLPRVSNIRMFEGVEHPEFGTYFSWFKPSCPIPFGVTTSKENGTG